jgi:hypothetical protein
MASSYTTNLGFEKQADGENATTWGAKVNTVFDLIEDAIAGVGSISMTADANKTLTDTDGAADESRSAVLEFTSTLSLTATRSIIVPTSGKIYVVKNGTTGGQSLTITTLSGTGVTIPNGGVRTVYCDGTNVAAVGAGSGTTTSYIQIDASYARFYVNGVNVLSVDASGNAIFKGNVTSNGTPA